MLGSGEVKGNPLRLLKVGASTYIFGMTHEWWRDAVIYQVYVRSFADADGDGVGDLPGVRSRLPYLAELGVDAVWLTPFYTSPMADGGYDVADYRDVDPLFGTLADARALVADAHELGLRVIVDVVPNHTSDQHEWFRAGLRDRYVFRPGRGDGPPNDWRSIFGGPAWTQVEDGEWYLHLFAPEQPDLNWEHPAVHAEFLDILRFWLDLGVDGFRVDAAHGMVKAAGLPDVGSADQASLLGSAPLPYFDQDGVHEIYRQWRAVLDSYEGGRILVAEAWVQPADRLARYVRPDEMHQAFNFEYLDAPWSADPLRKIIDATAAANAAVGAPTTWVLSNHDVVRHATRLGYPVGEPRRHGIGIGDPQPDVALGLRRARAATLQMLALPGSAYLYQGEELGLPEATEIPDSYRQDPAWVRSGHTERGRDGCRVPIPWEADAPSYGFGPTDASWLPQPAIWAEYALDRQRGVTGSTYELYRTALRLRATHGLGGGTLRWLDTPADVLAFRNGELLVLTNFGDAAAELPLNARVQLSSAPLTSDGRVPQDVTVWARV